MNNGKVRIYELSRELNLDNKDILAVCEQLNIAVKSHSSTITESEAERIRSAAEKYSASHSSPSKAAPVSHGVNSSSLDTRVRPNVKKQQILEIRKYQTSSPKSMEPEEYNPPVSPVSSSAQSSSMKLTAPPHRPVRPQTVVPASPNLPEEPTSGHDEQDSPEHTQAQDQPEIETTEAPTPNMVEDQPELIRPPARPMAAMSDSPRPSLSDRPTLKRAKIDKVSETGADSTRVSESQVSEPQVSESPTQAPSPAKRPRLQSPSPRSASSEEKRPVSRSRPGSATESSEEQSTPRPQQILELRRPRPVRPGEAPSRDSGSAPAARTTVESGSPEIPDVLELQLNRPAPPRPPKRAKRREDEEEEMQELEKAGKAPGKAKRRAQPLIDEDEDDLDIDPDDLQESTQISLSLARPPKPKGRPGQVKAAPATAIPAAQRKKPGAPRDSSSRGNRRERREQEVKAERPTQLVLTGSLTVQELAEALAVPETDIVRTLFFKGIAATVTQSLDVPTASMVAEELEVEVEIAEQESEARKVTEMLDVGDLEHLIRRPPVVTIMGHVDHGKTTLLDSIRKTKVAQGEAGGITQHIGAYHVDVEHQGQKQQVVFLDTPGHEAFTAMRARGTRVTDIAVLVVAADDGVRPQTIEAISHAKAAEVPLVVAINKIDKEGAQPDRVKQELTEYGLVSEEWGGDTIMVPVSALNGENLDTLLEMILLVSEVEELSANPNRPAKGTVIEAHLDKAKGPVATLLIQNGTLRVGDVLVAGSALGKVRAMVDDRGQRVEAASPSFAVEVLGLGDVPAAGDEFEVFPDDKEARALASQRSDQQRQSRLQQTMSARRVTLNTLSAQAQEGQLKELNLILKADVQGSVEAILGALKQLPQNEVQVRVLLSAPGEVTETDVDLAAASDAVIIGFNTTLASGARQAADQAGVDVREYNIIYKLLEDIQGAMEGLLEPEMVEEPLGQVEVRAVFPVGRGSVAGCYVLSGKVIRNCKVRVHRGSNVIYEGTLDSLKRMKEDAKEVNAGFECGIGIDKFNDWTEGDIIEAFRLVSKRRTLSAS